MNYFLHFVTPFGTSLIITLLLIPLWISICKKWKLFDEPDGRKHHKKLIPSMGGIAIFAGLFIAFLTFAQINDQEKLRYLFGGSLILFFTGFFDDFMDVPPMKKMLLQAISTCVIYFGGFRIVNLDGILGFHEVWIYLQLPLTLLLVLSFTNAFNFIDGVDGLAASIGVIASSCFGALFWYYTKYDYAILAFCTTGSLLGFLFYNFNPAKIFMGDTGSLVIGFLLSAMSIELLNTGISSTVPAANPAFIFAVLFLPLFDIVRVLTIRTLNGKKLMGADRNHIHHLILSHGFGHKSATLLMAAFSLFFISIQQLLPTMPVNIFIICSIVIAVIIINARVIAILATLHHKFFGNKQYKKYPIKSN